MELEITQQNYKAVNLKFIHFDFVCRMANIAKVTVVCKMYLTAVSFSSISQDIQCLKKQKAQTQFIGVKWPGT